MSTNKFLALMAAAAVVAATPAAAQDAPEPSTPTSPTSQAPDDAVEQTPLSDEELAALRGGEALVVSNQTMVAITSGNVIAGDYAAGNITLSDFSLSNFNGLGNLLLNTGGQVSIQAGMNLTINVGE